VIVMHRRHRPMTRLLLRLQCLKLQVQPYVYCGLLAFTIASLCVPHQTLIAQVAQTRPASLAELIASTPGSISQSEYERIHNELLKRLESPSPAVATAAATSAPSASAPLFKPPHSGTASGAAAETTPVRPIARRGHVTPIDVVRTFMHKRPPGPGRDSAAPTTPFPVTRQFSAAATPSPFDAAPYTRQSASTASSSSFYSSSVNRQFERVEPYSTGRVARVRNPIFATPKYSARTTPIPVDHLAVCCRHTGSVRPYTHQTNCCIHTHTLSLSLYAGL
jgi:pyruvate/2-oxoglutarate dehydrogenase complex dihydrolipoamide acyltransferase (E2) component